MNVNQDISLSRPAALVVDPEPPALQALVRLLETTGFDGFGTNRVDEAHRLVERFHPRLLIVDPGLAGVGDLVAEARAREPRVGVIAVKWAGGVDGDSGLVDADRIVLKTGPLSEVVAAIRTVAGRGPAPATVDRGAVLVVDDDGLGREALGMRVESLGYRAYTAKTADQALQLHNVYPGIGVGLVDLILPGASGMDLLVRLTERDMHPEVVMMSALADREVARRCFELGAFDFLLKPISADLLETTLRSAIGHRGSRTSPWWRRPAA